MAMKLPSSFEILGIPLVNSFSNATTKCAELMAEGIHLTPDGSVIRVLTFY